MLEGLDKVDWKSLRHVVGEPEKIPLSIRDLLSDDLKKRERAIDFLFSGGQHVGLGVIYSSTSAIIPFMLELLGYNETPGKEDILHALSTVAYEEIFFAGGLRITEAQNQIKTYEAIVEGFELFLLLLRHDITAIRRESANLLGTFEKSIPYLIESFLNETDETVQVALIKSLSRILKRQEKRVGVEQVYKDFLNDIVNTSDKFLVRVAAARASASIAISAKWERSPRLHGEIPLNIVDTLKSSFFTGDFYDKMEILHLMQRLSVRYLADFISHPAILFTDAHLIAQYLLNGLFEIGVFEYDDLVYSIREIEIENEKVVYGFRYDLKQTLNEYQKTALLAIVSCDVFWEKDSNFFSFFYNLPDSRDELRKLIADR
jgi:hypothetical protein